MIKKSIPYLPLFILFFLFNCNKKEIESTYPLHVGDIAFNEDIDDPDFFICNEKRIPQYYGFNESPFLEEKTDLLDYFHNNYSNNDFENENGFISIRFIINCKGESGRFRMQEMDLDLVEHKFNTDLLEKIFSLSKQYKGWNNIIHKKQPYDYYYYLTFKIINGEIKEILP